MIQNGQAPTTTEKARIEELERVIGKQTVEIQVLKKLESPLMADHELISMLTAESVPVSVVCRTLQMGRSTYYRASRTAILQAAQRASQDDRELLELIKAIKLEHPFWGYRRVRAFAKKKLGKAVNHKRIYRLMKKHDLLVQVKHYKAKRTPQTHKPTATHKNHWWGSDMTKFYVVASQFLG